MTHTVGWARNGSPHTLWEINTKTVIVDVNFSTLTPFGRNNRTLNWRKRMPTTIWPILVCFTVLLGAKLHSSGLPFRIENGVPERQSYSYEKEKKKKIGRKTTFIAFGCGAAYRNQNIKHFALRENDTDLDFHNANQFEIMMILRPKFTLRLLTAHPSLSLVLCDSFSPSSGFLLGFVCFST